MSSILKGIVDESENVAVIYIDGKAAAKYARKHEAERDAEFMRERFPNKKIEIKQEVRESVVLDENLHKWFKEKWVRFGPDGKIRGDCARGDDSEGKPKCLPQKKAHALGKKGRKYAASKKRREDPNPERRGPAKNVATKKKTNESMNEDVGGNYLYHATGGLKSILQSGYVDPAGTPQDATYAQTNRPTVSLTRDWGYASGSNAPEMTGGIARHAILVFDRSRIENNFKTLATSQSWETRGTAFPDPGNLKAGQQARSYDVDGDGTLTSKDADEVFRRQMMTKPDGTPMSRQEVGQKMGILKVAFYSPKAGHEFEEAVVVSKKGLPIKGTMIGFWVNPKSDLTKDPEVMNNPLRLEKTGPNKFVKASEKVMNEEKCPHCGGELVSEEMMNEKKDACYRKVKARYKVWPSAYASGALVQCRKKGAANWGNKSKKNESNIMKGIVDEGDVVPFKKKTDKDKYNTAIAKQRGPLPISYIDPNSAITVKSIKPGDPIQIPDEYQDINLKSKIRGVPKQNQTNFEVWGNDHGYYVFGNNTNAVLSAWPNGEMMVLSDPSDPKGRENCQRFAKQVMKPIELDSLRPKLKNKIVQKMSMIDQPMNEGVIVGHDANDPEVAILGGAGTMSLSRLKKKAQGEAEQLANDLARGRFKAAAYNVKQLANTLNTIVAAEEEMEKKYFGETDEHDYSDYEERNMLDDLYDMDLPKPGDSVTIDGRHGIVKSEVNQDTYGGPAEFEVKYDDGTVRLHSVDTILNGDSSYDEDFIDEDYTGEFAAEKTPAINPYGGLKDKQHRGAISETPTDNPTGASGEGGWRKYKPKSAGTVEEDTAYAGGMGQGGNAGQSYRKFKPKSAGTFKEEEQLDEKCWNSHKQVGMKKKGDKMVPNCVPKESAIMKGLKR